MMTIIKAVVFCVILFSLATLCEAQDVTQKAEKFKAILEETTKKLIPRNEMQKYLQPFQITKLDWILLRAQTESFSQLGKGAWDDFGLVTSISVYRIYLSAPIGMTFTIDNGAYLKLQRDILAKVFEYAVNEAYNILHHSIPEANLQSDVYANFVLMGGTGAIVAEFKGGRIVFLK